MMLNQKEIVLVLHHTYLHDAFRDYPNFTMDRYEQLKYCRFIVNFIIEKKTDNPSGEVAITFKKSYDSFYDIFNKSAKTGGAYRFIRILEKLILIINAENIDKLDMDDGTIAIADKIYSTDANYEPILIISNSARDAFVKKAEAFYKATLKERFTNIPFRILTVEEAKPFLKDRYADICKMVEDRMGANLGV